MLDSEWARIIDRQLSRTAGGPEERKSEPCFTNQAAGHREYDFEIMPPKPGYANYGNFFSVDSNYVYAWLQERAHPDNEFVERFSLVQGNWTSDVVLIDLK